MAVDINCCKDYSDRAPSFRARGIRVQTCIHLSRFSMCLTFGPDFRLEYPSDSLIFFTSRRRLSNSSARCRSASTTRCLLQSPEILAAAYEISSAGAMSHDTFSRTRPTTVPVSSVSSYHPSSPTHLRQSAFLHQGHNIQSSLAMSLPHTPRFQQTAELRRVVGRGSRRYLPAGAAPPSSIVLVRSDPSGFFSSSRYPSHELSQTHVLAQGFLPSMSCTRRLWSRLPPRGDDGGEYRPAKEQPDCARPPCHQ